MMLQDHLQHFAMQNAAVRRNDMSNDLEFTVNVGNKNSQHFLLLQLLLTWGLGLLALSGIAAILICLTKLFLQ